MTTIRYPLPLSPEDISDDASTPPSSPSSEDHPPMVAWNLGPTWAAETSRHYRNSTRPIWAERIRETPKAYLIRTPTREAWVPKSLVSHDPEKGVFTVPSWLAQQKLLD